MEIAEQTIKELYTVEGFQTHFEGLMRDNPGFSMANAYEALEKKYESIFGQRRYKSFESFSVIRNRLIKSKRI